MRISKERVDARLRVTKTQIMIEEALSKAEDELGITIVETLKALGAVADSRIEILFKDATPQEGM